MSLKGGEFPAMDNLKLAKGLSITSNNANFMKVDQMKEVFPDNEPDD